MDRLYCTLQELFDDIAQQGVKNLRESMAMDKIRSISAFIDQHIGNFIPVTEARRYDGEGGIDLWVDALLALTALTDDGTSVTLSDLDKYPLNRLWENGPYVRLTIDEQASSIGVWSVGDDKILATGRWGLYEETRATGATVSSQLVGASTLAVDNASGISPGMTVLIESEQELIESTGAPSDSTANLAEDLDASEEEIDVNNGTLLYAGEIARVDFEQMRILAIQTNTLLVERGYNGSKRATHSNGADVYVYRTYNVKRGVNGTTAAAHTSKAVSRYVIPADVNGLARQMAALLYRKALSGYAGKTGNAELGEVYYMQEYPREAIERVKNNYRVPVV